MMNGFEKCSNWNHVHAPVRAAGVSEAMCRLVPGHHTTSTLPAQYWQQQQQQQPADL